MRAFVAITAAIGLLTMTGVAAAQDKVESTKNEKLDSWVFPDDKLLTVTPGNPEMKIRVGAPAVRILLVRPRTQFVPELLKTIESL